MTDVSSRHPETDSLACFYLMAANTIPGGRCVQVIKSWSLLKSKSFWFSLFAKSFDTLSTLRWFPMVWIPSSQDRRQKLPHFWVSFASRVQSCDLGSAYQMHIQRYRYRSDFCVEAGGCRASIFQAQIAGEAVWFWNYQEQRISSQPLLHRGSGDCSWKLTPKPVSSVLPKTLWAF